MKAVWVPACLGLLAGCAAEPPRSIETYINAASAGSFAPISSEPRLTAFLEVFTHLDDTQLAEKIERAYAPILYFNDTFHELHDRKVLINYLLSLQGEAKTTVTPLDVVVHGDHALVRWVMRIEFRVLRKEVDIRSVGITHLHWNSVGQIDLHQDYWDGVEGFYAQLPLLGGLVRGVRARLGEVSE